LKTQCFVEVASVSKLACIDERHSDPHNQPLPFTDLEPKRFEDLVRQLVYDFRPWRRLEATGRSGSDDGFDARALEIVEATDTPTAASQATQIRAEIATKRKLKKAVLSSSAVVLVRDPLAEEYPHEAKLSPGFVRGFCWAKRTSKQPVSG
jgi:hypothetical protein